MEKNNIISDWLDQYGNPEIDKFIETQLNQNNMTAVEWLVEQLAKNGILHSSDIAKAKEMEKHQSIHKLFVGFEEWHKHEYGSKYVEIDQFNEYLQTFKSE